MSMNKEVAAQSPSLYLSFGVTKTGSTLAYHMTRHFLECRGFSQALLPDELQIAARDLNAVSAENIDLVENIADWAAARGIMLALKTHLPPGKGIGKLLKEGRAIGHATYRDPREVALSLVDHGAEVKAQGQDPIRFRELHVPRDSADLIERQLGVLDRWERQPSIALWYYDDFAFDHKGAFDRLAKQTGHARLTAEERNTFDQRSGTKFNKAVKERWRTDLNADDSAYFQDRFAGFYASLRLRRLSWKSPTIWSAAKRVVG